MRQIKTDFIREPRYRTWVRERPLWWIMYRTEKPGSFTDNDADEFNKCKGKYIIFFDHVYDPHARELSLYLLDRFSHFKLAKVSKVARDGEKTLVLLAKDNRLYDSLKEFITKWSDGNMVLFKFQAKDDETEHEKMTAFMWNDYLTKLSRAFKPPE